MYNVTTFRDIPYNTYVYAKLHTSTYVFDKYVQYIHYYNMYQCIGENLVQRVTQHMSLVMTTAVTVIMRKGQLYCTV